MRKRIAWAAVLLLCAAGGSLALLLHYRVPLVHSVVRRATLAKAPPAQRAALEQAFAQARAAAAAPGRERAYLEALFEISRRVEKVQILGEAASREVLRLLGAAPPPEPAGGAHPPGRGAPPVPQNGSPACVDPTQAVCYHAGAVGAAFLLLSHAAGSVRRHDFGSFPGTGLNCPDCSSADYVSGIPCPSCGHAAPAAAGHRPRRVVGGRIGPVRSVENLAFDFAREQAPQGDLPEWRAQLRKRVAEARERRRHPEAQHPAARQVPLPAPPPRPPEIRRTAIDPQPLTRSDRDIQKSLRDFHASIQAVPAQRHPATAAAHRPGVQHRLPAAQPEAAPPPAEAGAAPAAAPAPQGWIASRSILLTRTLSGLIDLLAVGGCSAMFLLVSSMAGDLDVFSPGFRPLAAGAVVFFQAGYSLYFLALAQRTPGMMLTGLKVVGEESRPLGFRGAALRTLAFFVSWLTLAGGLLWGLRDRDCRCLHDAWSGTRVIRC